MQKNIRIAGTYAVIAFLLGTLGAVGVGRKETVRETTTQGRAGATGASGATGATGAQGSEGAPGATAKPQASEKSSQSTTTTETNSKAPDSGSKHKHREVHNPKEQQLA